MNDVRTYGPHTALQSTGINILRLITAVLSLVLCHATIAQQPNSEIGDEHAEMMDAFLEKGPNSPPISYFRIVGFAAQGADGEFSIPVRIAEAQCTSAKCEINSRLDSNTEIIDGNGESIAARSLEKHRNHEAISIRFDDRGQGLVERIMLMPKRK